MNFIDSFPDEGRVKSNSLALQIGGSFVLQKPFERHFRVLLPVSQLTFN
jgi:hypothetical protein